jgi:CHASE3 domain sensor protein
MKSFSKMKIGTRLLFGFGLVTLIVGGIGEIADINMKMLDDRDGNLYRKTSLSLQCLGTASAAFQDIVLANRKLKTDHSAGRLSAADEELLHKKELIEKYLGAYASAMTDSSNTNRVTMLSEACRKYFAETNEYYVLLRNDQGYEANKLHRTVLDKDNNKITEAFHELMTVNAAETKRIRDENADILDSMRTLMFILIITVMAAALGLGFYFSRMIGNDLQQSSPNEQSGAEEPAAIPSLAASVMPQRTAAESNLCDAPAVQNQPVKKMRVFFDDTLEYTESDLVHHR